MEPCLLLGRWILYHWTTRKAQIRGLYIIWGASQVALLVKNPPANAGDIRDEGLIPGSGRSHGGGHGNPLQYFCLKNSMHREAWATVHRVAKSWPRRKQLSRQAGILSEARQRKNSLGLGEWRWNLWESDKFSKICYADLSFLLW